MFANRGTTALESRAMDNYLVDRVGDIDAPVRILVGDERPTWFERMARDLAKRMPLSLCSRQSSARELISPCLTCPP